ncbi:3 beta-hydroxysteroid dehydrogenase/Delta 5--_4-isomerase [Pandoraea eparura]|jgi:NADH dehydrogenase|uniref:3 beta-hydroxysteroid dehydrogenase/Delta 5-->4-isomerase n=1 Tax=Pandoraea eparura TaxID=2508291 RepID=A0A5E4TKB3_9BURK|nr:complex I NDUFA9 subunit family protein [Pandoraea eparura]VVD86958.1 3 beta-hydroxysteroid dehydrogenase/Delta 5-->4-isomerase [Pandoraea eparura]
MRYNVCVVGGTGFIGSHLVARLVSMGHAVRLPTRRVEAAKALGVLPGVELVECDVHDPRALERVIAGSDAVINLVGILHSDRGMPYGRAFARAHVELPRTIAQACSDRGIARLIHMSALGADSNGPSMYQRSKGDGEVAIRATGIPVTIFRPSVVFGPGDHFLNTFARLQRRLPVVPLACAKARFQPVYVTDVAQAFAQAIDNDATLGKTYELGGPEVYTLEALVRFAGAACGCERPILPLPERVARLQAILFEAMPGEPIITRDNLDSMRVDNVMSGPLAPELGLIPNGLEVAVDYLDGDNEARRLSDYRRYAGR